MSALNSGLNSSVVSAATRVGSKLFQWGIVLGKKEYSRACNTVSFVLNWWTLFSETGSSTCLYQ